MLAKSALSFIRFYQRYISPMSPPTCRFYPTCSHYAKEAIERHGFWYGGWLSVKRISKCHPLHSGGIDLVPDKKPSLCKILRKC
ncbi:membrane protein insertion efficiency factor YidD [Rubeoparvulum massiliense]|uniref:membrane protein insertion efficiency factor YidD n=1 Tax=Rubeoparvulum massiliense TaxID=1631346 RepID=UPI0009779046|nr:membrane protein insertion efficiency factor YidD [Rubeoparvulum massiliense]